MQDLGALFLELWELNENVLNKGVYGKICVCSSVECSNRSGTLGGHCSIARQKMIFWNKEVLMDVGKGVLTQEIEEAKSLYLIMGWMWRERLLNE